MTIAELDRKAARDYKKRLVNEQAELEACSQGFQGCQYFLKKYGWIINRNTAQKVKWEPWEFHLDVLEALCTFPDIILFKARQLGWTWLVSGWADWKVNTQDAVKGLFLSAGESKAWEMIGKTRFIHNHLPPFLALQEKHPENKALMNFQDSDSEFNALPSTKDAGRSTDATFVIRDELKDHPYASDNFASVSPTIDSGGTLIDLSTIDKEAVNNHFTERINRAMLGAKRIDLKSGLTMFHGGDSQAVLLFGGWRLRPVRQEGLSLDEWFEQRVKPKYSAFQIEAEYPETIEQALAMSKERAFFDVQALEDMLLYVQQPIQTGEIDTMGGMIKLYQLPVVGEKYCAFADPSDGRDDPHAIGILHPRSGNIVAVSHGKVPADQCAKAFHTLICYYNNAFNSYEVNATAGGKFAESLKMLETPNRHGFRKGQLSKEDGWWTGENVKRDMRDGLEEAIRKRLIILHNREAIEELRGFIVPEGGIPQPARGLHDDWVMMLGGLWQIRKFMPYGSGKAYSFNYQQRW